MTRLKGESLLGETRLLVKCQHCNTPVFEVTKEGMVVLKERHHGQWHTSVWRIEDLKKVESPDDPKHVDNIRK